MCGHGEFHGHYWDEGCCCENSRFRGRPFHRRFPSQEEQITRLEEYLKDLQAETKAVEQLLAEMKAAK
jgi:hypothetical protein